MGEAHPNGEGCHILYNLVAPGSHASGIKGLRILFYSIDNKGEWTHILALHHGSVLKSGFNLPSHFTFCPHRAKLH